MLLVLAAGWLYHEKSQSEQKLRPFEEIADRQFPKTPRDERLDRLANAVLSLSNEVWRAIERAQEKKAFTGGVVCKGRKIVLEGRPLAFVRVNFNRGTVEYNSGPMPDPQPPFEMWYEVAHTFGDIVIP